jgi:hypothetical protein
LLSQRIASIISGKVSFRMSAERSR